MATLPVGWSAPAYGNEDEDRSGWAVIAAGVALLFVLMFGAMRVFIRWPFNGRLLKDDATLFVASVFAIVQTILIIAAAGSGLGQSKTILSESQVTISEKIVYTADIFCITALYLSKAAVLFLLLALSREKAHEILVTGALAVCGVGMVAGIVMAGIGCTNSAPWTFTSSTCTSLFPRWVAVEAIGVALELYLFAVLIRMLRGIQRNWAGKYKAVAIFALRLPLVVLSTYRLMALHRLGSSEDPTIDRIASIAWTEFAMTYSLITATLPSLVPFLTALNTGLGTYGLDNAIHTSQQGSSGGTYAMGYIKGGSHGTIGSRTNRISQIRPEGANYRTTAAKADRVSTESDDSQRVIIRRTVDVSFEPAMPKNSDEECHE